MRGWLIDTNVLSELRRRPVRTPIAAWFSEQAIDRLWTSTLVFAEIQHGIKQADVALQPALTAWLETIVRPGFAGRLLALDEATLVRWLALQTEARARQQTLPQVDGLIAAQALQHGLGIATRNVKHFAGLGLALLNPWEPRP
jgi:toxin FitB